MISSVTFAEYFQKEDLQGQQAIYPADDVRLFGREIAPVLNIKKRFAGYEPLDTVTQQYNDAMRDILPEYDVEFVEIPRLTLADGEIINATKVRELIKKGAFHKLKRYVLEETFRYIQSKGKHILQK